MHAGLVQPNPGVELLQKIEISRERGADHSIIEDESTLWTGALECFALVGAFSAIEAGVVFTGQLLPITKLPTVSFVAVAVEARDKILTRPVSTGHSKAFIDFGLATLTLVAWGLTNEQMDKCFIKTMEPQTSDSILNVTR